MERLQSVRTMIKGLVPFRRSRWSPPALSPALLLVLPMLVRRGISRNLSGKLWRAFPVTGPLVSFSFTRQNMWSRVIFCAMTAIIGDPDFQTGPGRRLARRFMDGLRTFDLKF